MKRRLFDIAAYWTAPLLLLAVAGWWTYLVEADAYTRGWKGANFDMFAEIDGAAMRVPHCYRLGPDGDTHVPCPEAVAPYLKDAKLVPRDDRITRAARYLYAHLREEDSTPIAGARVELWQFDYRPRPAELVFRKRYERTWSPSADE